MESGDIREIENMLLSVAQRMRQSDTYFRDLPLEHKNVLNMTGKVLGELYSLLLTYRHADDEERIVIAKKVYRILKCIENIEKGGVKDGRTEL